jgi:hypothetical protein
MTRICQQRTAAWQISESASAVYLLPRRHKALLVAIVTTIAVRPLVADAGNGLVVFSIAMLALMLVSLYTIQIH